MIFGLGTDIVEIERIEKLYSKYGINFANRILNPKEQKDLEGNRFPVKFLAKRFAAKEALAKALSVGHGLQWHEAEVINLENGKPEFLFRGEIAELISGLRVHLSLSHDGGIASAIVVIEEKA